MKLSCEDLGITRDDILGRIAREALHSYYTDEDGHQFDAINQQIAQEVQELVAGTIKEEVTAQFDAVVKEGIGSLRFPQTNAYGEPKREPMTLREYVGEHVTRWMREKVDSQGRTGQGVYGGVQERLVWLVHKHMDLMIRRELEKVVGTANKELTDALQREASAKLAEISKKLKVRVTT